MWQDVVFLAGSTFSIVCLAPTLRDANARVPLATSVPSMSIGLIYAATFFTLGMTFSGVGSLSAGVMWSLIAVIRSPRGDVYRATRRDGLLFFADDLLRQVETRLSSPALEDQYVLEE